MPGAPPATLQAALDGLLGSDPSPAALADTLDLALPLASVDAAMQQLQAAASLRTQLQSLGLPAAIAALQAAHDDLVGSKPQLQSVLAAMNSYVSSWYPSGGAPAGAWTALVAAVQAAGSAAGAAVGQVPPLGPVFTQVGKACRISGPGLGVVGPSLCYQGASRLKWHAFGRGGCLLVARKKARWPGSRVSRAVCQGGCHMAQNVSRLWTHLPTALARAFVLSTIPPPSTACNPRCCTAGGDISGGVAQPAHCHCQPAGRRRRHAGPATPAARRHALPFFPG